MQPLQMIPISTPSWAFRLIWAALLCLPSISSSEAQTDRPIELHTKCEGDVFYCGGFEREILLKDVPEFFEMDGKKGARQPDGAIILQPIYDTLSIDKYKPLLKATQGSQHFWFDFHGSTVEEQIALSPDQQKRKDYLGCDQGLSIFQKNGLFGMKWDNGEIQIKPEYEALTCYRYGFAWGAISEIRLWCPIDQTGEMRVTPDCKKSVATFPRGLVYQGSFDFEGSVLWNRAYREYGLGKRAHPPQVYSQPTF